MVNVLITGEKGLIGKRLISLINQHSENTNIFTLPCKIKYENFSLLEEYFASIKKIDYIYHLADLNGNARWLAKNNYTQFDANTQCLSILLNLIVTQHCDAKLICLGSAWAYPSNKAVVEEKDFGKLPLIKGLESYAKAKIFQFDLLNFAFQEKNINFSFFPICTIYGDTDNSDHLIPSLIRRISSKPETLEIYTDGNELRNFLHVDDLSYALYLFRDCSCKIMNISNKERISIKNVVELIKKHSSYKGKVKYSSVIGLDTPELSVQLSELKYNWPSQFKLKDLNSILYKN